MRGRCQRALARMMCGPSIAVADLVSQQQARVPTYLSHHLIIDRAAAGLCSSLSGCYMSLSISANFLRA